MSYDYMQAKAIRSEPKKNGAKKQQRKRQDQYRKCNISGVGRSAADHPVYSAELYGIGAKKSKSRKGKLRGAAARKERKRRKYEK